MERRTDGELFGPWHLQAMDLSQRPVRPKILPFSQPRLSNAKHCIHPERGNCPRRSQRDPPRDDGSQEGFRGPSKRDRCVETASRGNGASTSRPRQERATCPCGCGKRRGDPRRNALQRERPSCAPQATRPFSRRPGTPDRSFSPIHLQLGERQGPAASQIPADARCPADSGQERNAGTPGGFEERCLRHGSAPGVATPAPRAESRTTRPSSARRRSS